jgi:hypothetical protein
MPNELRINVLRSQNIIPVELSRAFHLDFKVSVPGVGNYRWSQSSLRQLGVRVKIFFERCSLTYQLTTFSCMDRCDSNDFGPKRAQQFYGHFESIWT